MKLFKLAKRNFALLGIKSHKSIRVYRRILFAFASYATNNILNYAFILHGGHSFVEYADIACMSATTTMIGIFYTIVVIKMDKFLEFVDSCNEIATKSE